MALSMIFIKACEYFHTDFAETKIEFSLLKLCFRTDFRLTKKISIKICMYARMLQKKSVKYLPMKLSFKIKIVFQAVLTFDGETAFFLRIKKIRNTIRTTSMAPRIRAMKNVRAVRPCWYKI